MESSSVEDKTCTFREKTGAPGMEVGISKGGLKNRKKTQRRSKTMLGSSVRSGEMVKGGLECQGKHFGTDPINS